jgi:hypothetical protein
LQVVSGNNQAGTVGTTLPQALIAQLRDTSGNGVANQAVTWDVVQGNGALSATTTTTDQLGRVSTNFMPSVAGTSQVRVRLASNLATEAVFTATASTGTPGCTFGLSPTSLSVPASGQAGSVSITASSFFCSWTAQSNVNWIQITGTAAGSGSAPIMFTVSPNTGAARTGAITAGGQTLTINQAGAGQTGCSFTVNPTDLSPPSSGATGTISVTSTGTCEWTASWDSPWLVVTPPGGSGSGTAAYTVYPNFGTRTRVGHFTVAGQSITVTQGGTFGTEPGRFVSQIYFNFFGRIPSTSEIAFQLNALNTIITRAQMVENFLTSEEFNRAGRFVAGLYVGLFNRDPEFSGWLFNRNAFASGMVTPAQAVANFLNSTEFVLKYGTPPAAQFVTLLYTQILLRAPSQSEIDFMVNALTGGLSRVDMATNFLNSAEFRTGTGPRLTAFALYATILGRDLTSAERLALISQLQSGASVQTIIQGLLNSPEFQALLQ